MVSLAGHGETVALQMDDESTTYSELWNNILAASHWLRSHGVGAGDRIATLARNGPELPVVFWAAQAIGAVFVPLNPSWTTDEVAYALSDADSSRVVIDEALADRLPERLHTRAVWLGAASTNGDGARAGHCWAEVVADRGHRCLPDVVIGPDHLATIVYTSGTTGRPRGVVHTHANHCASVSNALITARVMQHVAGNTVPDQSGQSAVLHTLPWFHVAGLGAIYTSLLAGSKNVIMRRWDAQEALRIIEEQRINSLGAVPTMLGQLVMEEGRNTGKDLTSLKAVSSGAAAVPSALLHSVKDHVGRQAMLVTGYGLTETTASIALSVGDDLFRKPESVGVPYPVNTIKLLTAEGTEAPPGQAGEIWVSGPTVAKGYWRNPEATSKAFIDGGFRTGDLGMVDSDGYLFIVGRIKDVIIRGGENIQAAEVEQVIAELPGVMEVAVVGMPHPEYGEEVVAVITTYPHAEIDDQNVDDHCRNRLAKFKIPTRYIRDVPIPRTATGKSLKNQLRESLLTNIDTSPESGDAAPTTGRIQ
jgi:acyl-CoA synthetase (AMP-forming)/AMP-acid ligase II